MDRFKAGFLNKIEKIKRMNGESLNLQVEAKYGDEDKDDGGEGSGI